LGGSGLGLAEEAVVVELASGFVAPLPFVSTYAAAHVLAQGSGEATAELAGQLAAGDRVVGVALSAETSAPQGLVVHADGAGAGRLVGAIEDVFEGGSLDVLLVPVDGAWWAVDVRGAGVEFGEIGTLDATRRQARVVFEQAPARKVSEADLEQILSLARVLLGAEGLGAAQAALDMASAYSLERKQFGQPIGRFQAIKQKLADCLIKTEGARSAVWGALRSMTDGAPDPVAARLAKAEGGAAAAYSAAESVQTHGAIGVTWEYDLHLVMKRAKHCQLSLGSPDQHLRALGDNVLELEKAGKTPSRRKAKLELGFQPSPEDEAFIAPFRAWLDEHATEEAIDRVRRGGLSAQREWQAKMAEAGWVGIHWPSEYGGRDASFTQQILYYAEMIGRGLPNLPGNRGLMLVGPTLIAHGTPEQKKLLEPTRRADILWSGGFSERGAGSDLAGLQTRGVVDGDQLVINGHKIWTSQAQIADWLYALIRTDPAAPKHDGISVVLIPMKAKGVEVRPIRRNNGDFHFNEVFLDDVRIPAGNLVGPINEGWRVNRTTMVGEHLTNFLGSNAALATTIRRIARELVAHEAKYGLDPDLRRRFSEAWAINQIISLHGLRNVARFTGGENPGAEGSIQKVVGQEQERRLFELMLDVQGAGGLKDGVWTRAYLSTRASTIGGGTSEIHRNKLAERVLGLPRDLWADEELISAKGQPQTEMLDG
ncbi:MAG: acyl-CoA dehydrogenase, partial [Phenylobacterium sp.]|nr:acyl-CoA dehydrogenase [Phenylobacterium sp.]